jgi:hypothetical protein
MESMRPIAGTSSTWGSVGFHTCLCRKSHFLIDIIGMKKARERHKISKLTRKLDAKTILAIDTAVIATTVLHWRGELKNCIGIHKLTNRSTFSVSRDGRRFQDSSFA